MAAKHAAALSRFKRAEHGALANYKPRAVDDTEVAVMVFLDGQSVADVEELQQRKLSRIEKDTIAAGRAVEQVAPRAQIEAMGGKVTNSFHNVASSLRVNIARNKIASLRNIPGVKDVRPIGIHKLDNSVSIPRIQAPAAWVGATGSLPVHGEGIKVGIIDTGIDYTHLDFGGPGTVDAYNAALAADQADPDPTLVGPTAPKVKGGIDLVGDAYNASGTGDALNPHQDNNPLDCNSHGTHVAGTIAGFGILANGTAYTGPYDQTTHTANNFLVGPGVAPKADLYSIRVFGCSGSTDVVVEALEWAIDHDMDVVNMSLGSDFGPPDQADAVVADAAVRSGIVVVSAAGNAGTNIPYAVGDPGSSTRGIAAAASFAPATVRMANLAAPAVGADNTARNFTVINANNGNFTSPLTLTTVVLRNPDNSISLGCDPTEYTKAGVTGKAVIVSRGTCARVARAIFGQQAGAAAVIMLNTAPGLPPFEGQILQNPDDGKIFAVTIPFFGVAGNVATAGTDSKLMGLRDGVSITLTEGTPQQTGTASFSSSGARSNDSHLKPDITAPGNSIISAGMGTGNGFLIFSGTSMATPMTAGVAALTIQAHPTWSPAAIKAAIINSGIPGGLSGYLTRINGAGEVNAGASTGTLAYAYADPNEINVNFGMQEFSKDFRAKQLVHVKNTGPTSTTFNVSVVHQNGVPHTLTPDFTRLTVPAHSERTMNVTLNVPVATAGDSTAFFDAGGVITFTPSSQTQNHGQSLSLPYYFVPRVSSNVQVSLPKLTGSPPSATATVTNARSAIGATAEFYAWGLIDPSDVSPGRVDIRAAGVETFPDDPVTPTDSIVVFAINTYHSWSTTENCEFEVLIDNDGDGVPDFLLFTDDIGRLIGPFFTETGELVAVWKNLKTNELNVDFDLTVTTDGSTVILPVFGSDVGILPGTSPSFKYTIQSFDLFSDAQDAVDEWASFDAFSPAISNGDFLTLEAGDSQTSTVTVDPVQMRKTPVKGIMVVTQDNANGPAEANLVRAPF